MASGGGGYGMCGGGGGLDVTQITCEPLGGVGEGVFAPFFILITLGSAPSMGQWALVEILNLVGHNHTPDMWGTTTPV